MRSLAYKAELAGGNVFASCYLWNSECDVTLGNPSNYIYFPLSVCGRAGYLHGCACIMCMLMYLYTVRVAEVALYSNVFVYIALHQNIGDVYVYSVFPQPVTNRVRNSFLNPPPFFCCRY